MTDNKSITVVSAEDIRDDDIYKYVWLPVGDDKVKDIASLIQQNRLND